MRLARLIQLLYGKRLIHLCINQELGEKQDIPNSKDRQQEQGPRSKQHKYGPVPQLQEANAQYAPKIFDAEQQAFCRRMDVFC